MASIAAEDIVLAYLRKPNVLLLDVRSPGEFERGYVEGSVNLPHTSDFSSCSLLPKDRATPIVAYCAAGVRSAFACQKLDDMGYSDVINGGTWQGVLAATSESQRVRAAEAEAEALALAQRKGQMNKLLGLGVVLAIVGALLLAARRQGQR
eukprot:gnl/TRDRNA2_/TRDRNA2_193828_c0_seq1.p1 gnl/TRDRNA2_/TRDRNA2_193828_c0~~gnl/TRDRNA2_/TRDRNA2_193828_c0_seq1.p1  ORF type:complete len:169 (-),score=24.46 gnl/TRDRNA2_/TRDRNA2_193828_c0_seq1:15-467(-)